MSEKILIRLNVKEGMNIQDFMIHLSSIATDIEMFPSEEAFCIPICQGMLERHTAEDILSMNVILG